MAYANDICHLAEDRKGLLSSFNTREQARRACKIVPGVQRTAETLELDGMIQSQTQCPLHGREGIGLVCGHIALAVDRGERVGFFWGDDTDTARPDAWCLECEQKLLAVNGASSEQWFGDAHFKIFCAKCWDRAKTICGGFASPC